MLTFLNVSTQIWTQTLAAQKHPAFILQRACVSVVTTPH